MSTGEKDNAEGPVAETSSTGKGAVPHQPAAAVAVAVAASVAPSGSITTNKTSLPSGGNVPPAAQAQVVAKPKADTVAAARPPSVPIPASQTVAKPTVAAGGVASVAGGTIPVAPPPATKASTGGKSKKKKSQAGVTMATAPSSQPGSQGAQGENTGRWTAEEHRLFLQGLELHGKGWKKIASLIKSRTVVQIRTHAQKYFQKLAKARQNGEEGEIAMEGRMGVASATSVSTNAAQNAKRRRQTTGTKRKAIQSVVSSAQRQGKKMASAQSGTGVPIPAPPLPTVAPALAHFVLPTADGDKNQVATSSCVPSITTAQGTISGPALEDSLFRFLTPAPVSSSPQVNEVARQAGANPITLPSDNPSSAPTKAGGEVSPTGVSDLALYPSWTDAKDTPSWYAKGADVDALVDVGDDLDWLADSGDLHETYQPPPMESAPIETAPSMPQIHTSSPENAPEDHMHQVTTAPPTSSSLNSLPQVDSVVPPLPSIFDGADAGELMEPKVGTTFHSSTHLAESVSAADMDDHLQVFDSLHEENDFVSTILENTRD